MFERFTSDARGVVIAAQEHARRLHHDRVGTEHLLLALLACREPVARVLADAGISARAVEEAVATRRAADPIEHDRAALAALGIDLDQVRDAVEQRFGADAWTAAATGDRGRRRRGLRRRRRPRRPAGAAPAPVRGPVRGHLAFSRPAKAVLELALREALRLHHREITAAHIALGLLREGRGLGAAALADLGTDLDELRRTLEHTLQQAA